MGKGFEDEFLGLQLCGGGRHEGTIQASINKSKCKKSNDKQKD
jgi:hypothetical protein